MITQNISSFVYVGDVAEHAQMKPHVLNTIRAFGEHALIDGIQKISNTDWHLGQDFPRPYWDLLKGPITAHNVEVMKQAGYTAWNISNYWYQQYKTSDYHGWHVHGESMFSNVYYLDLPNKEIKTQFKVHGKTIEVDVKEGQILTFPSFMIHRSPENTCNRMKTIISFNSNFAKPI